MERYRKGLLRGDVVFNEGIMTPTAKGDWVKYVDMIEEVRNLLDDLGGVGDHVTNKDLEAYFKSGWE